MIRRRRLLLVFLLLLPAVALAQVPTCGILNYGIFRKVEALGSREAPATPGGTEFLAQAHAAIVQTDRVPGRIGVLFGVVHRFAGIPAGGFVAAVIRHPPLPTVEGGIMTQSLSRKDPGATGTGFRFDRAEEIAPGDWTFEFQYEGRVLCWKTLVVEAAN